MEETWLKSILVLMFLLSGIDKLINTRISVERIQKKISLDDNIAFVVIIAAGIWEILAVMGTFSKNKQIAIKSLYSLVIFTILATLLFYFPVDSRMRYYAFISNVTTIGGLLTMIEFIQRK